MRDVLFYGDRLKTKGLNLLSAPSNELVASTALAANKPLWIDFNAGAIVDGTPVEEVDQAFIDFVIGVASGEHTNNEKSDVTL